MWIKSRKLPLECMKNSQRICQHIKGTQQLSCLSQMHHDNGQCVKLGEMVPFGFPRMSRHSFHTTTTSLNKVEVYNVNMNPMASISMKIKMFVLKNYFDGDFDVNEFALGTKQAISYVSTKISEGKINELDGVSTSKGIQACQYLYNEHDGNPNFIRIDHEDFLKVFIRNISFELNQTGERHADILVGVIATNKEGRKSTTHKEFGNMSIEVVGMVPRLVRFTFRRDFTPGRSILNG